MIKITIIFFFLSNVFQSRNDLSIRNCVSRVSTNTIEIIYLPPTIIISYSVRGHFLSGVLYFTKGFPRVGGCRGEERPPGAFKNFLRLRMVCRNANDYLLIFNGKRFYFFFLFLDLFWSMIKRYDNYGAIHRPTQVDNNSGSRGQGSEESYVHIEGFLKNHGFFFLLNSKIHFFFFIYLYSTSTLNGN